MNAAQKAWATRRARAAAAAAIVPVQTILDANKRPKAIVHRDYGGYVPNVYVPPVLEPVTELEVIDIWLDHSDVGCGERRFIVLAKSRRDVQLFYVPRLQSIIIPRETYDRDRISNRKVHPKVIVQIIRQKQKLVDQINSAAGQEVMGDGGADTEAALKLLTTPRKRERNRATAQKMETAQCQS